MFTQHFACLKPAGKNSPVIKKIMGTEGNRHSVPPNEVPALCLMDQD